jgi:hypothetical protein
MAVPLHRLVLAACLALGACRDDNTQKLKEPPPAPVCGDGRVNAGLGEECDGAELAGATCGSLGFDTGVLSCSDQCKWDTSACVKRCGNGLLDLGEECDGALGAFTCSTYGYKACNATCTLDTVHCITDAFGTAPALVLDKGGPAEIADVAPKGYGDLVVAVPSFLRLETYPYTVAQGFVPGRKVAAAGAPALPLAADLDGDTETDLAAITLDGKVERFRYLPASNTFPAESYPAADAGVVCPAFAWVGAGNTSGAAAMDLVALGCPSGTGPFKAAALLVFKGGATATAPLQLPVPGLVSAALADADHDGLADLLYVDDTLPAQLRVLRSTPPGFTAAAPLPLPFAPLSFAAADLDGDADLDLVAFDGAAVKVLEDTGLGFTERASFPASAALGLRIADVDLDGRPDLVWLDADRLKVRRNAGSFQFTPFEATTGPGTPLVLSVGDVDGDGDLDFAATCRSGTDSTVTYLLINKVR